MAGVSRSSRSRRLPEVFSQAGVLPSLRDPVALDVNRRGALTTSQAALLAERAREFRRRRVVQTAATTLVGIVVILLLASPSTSMGLLGLGAVIVLLAWLQFRPWADPLADDVREGRVESVAGEVRRPARSVGSVFGRAVLTLLAGSVDAWRADERTEVAVGDRIFAAALDDAARLRAEPRVRAYFLPRSSTLVGFEPIDGEGPDAT